MEMKQEEMARPTALEESWLKKIISKALNSITNHHMIKSKWNKCMISDQSYELPSADERLHEKKIALNIKDTS